jgi:hypothetical protein
MNPCGARSHASIGLVPCLTKGARHRLRPFASSSSPGNDLAASSRMNFCSFDSLVVRSLSTSKGYTFLYQSKRYNRYSGWRRQTKLSNVARRSGTRGRRAKLSDVDVTQNCATWNTLRKITEGPKGQLRGCPRVNSRRSRAIVTRKS